MSSTRSGKALKRATNLTVNAEILAQAKVLGINLSAVLEEALIEALRAKKRDKWLEDNTAAIATYNEQVEQHGVFGAAGRTF